MCASAKYCSNECDGIELSVFMCHGGLSGLIRYSPSVTGPAGWAAGVRVAGGGEELNGLIELSGPP